MNLVKRAALAAIITLSCAAWPQASADPTIEDSLLSMMNHVRSDAGLPALKPEPRLNDAAYMHLVEFIKSGELSDQFEGEPSLLDRARKARVSCGSVGEIMLKVADLSQVPDQLKVSESARRSLLNPKFSIAGVAQMVSGDRLFIVVNLVRPLEAFSPDEIEGLVVETAQHARESHKLMPFKLLPMRRLHGMACDMAKKDSLKIAPLDPSTEYPNALNTVGQTVVFTTNDPHVMPASVQAVGFDPKLNAISAGVCFGRSPSHPDGTYWVSLMFWAIR
jgi:hypothetical protein